MSVIVITGGSRGIGASTAELCARQGHGVILTYTRNPDAAQALVQRIEAAGGKALALQLDVADVSAFAAFRDTVTLALSTTWGVNPPLLPAYRLVKISQRVSRTIVSPGRSWGSSGPPSVPCRQDSTAGSSPRTRTVLGGSSPAGVSGRCRR